MHNITAGTGFYGTEDDTNREPAPRRKESDQFPRESTSEYNF
jgi:hypothetical protein